MAKYTPQELLDSARKFSSRSEWRNTENSQYQTAKRVGLPQQCVGHMVDLRTVKTYTDQEIIDKARWYKSSTEWRTKDLASYRLARNRKLLPQCTLHMPRQSGIYSGIYQVYVYKFPDKTAYVGLTCVPEQRHDQHRASGRVRAKATQLGISVPDPVILEDRIMSPCIAQHAETTWMERLVNDGHQLLNSALGGSIGSIGSKVPPKWTKENVLKISSGFHTTKDWVCFNSSSYDAASRNGWLHEATAHMAKPVKWTIEKIKETALHYTDLSKFCKEQPSCATVATRLKIFRDVTSHIPRKIKRRHKDGP